MYNDFTQLVETLIKPAVINKKFKLFEQRPQEQNAYLLYVGVHPDEIKVPLYYKSSKDLIDSNIFMSVVYIVDYNKRNLSLEQISDLLYVKPFNFINKSSQNWKELIADFKLLIMNCLLTEHQLLKFHSLLNLIKLLHNHDWYQHLLKCINQQNAINLTENLLLAGYASSNTMRLTTQDVVALSTVALAKELPKRFYTIGLEQLREASKTVLATANPDLFGLLTTLKSINFDNKLDLYSLDTSILTAINYLVASSIELNNQEIKSEVETLVAVSNLDK